jgi:hypothetical protein
MEPKDGGVLDELYAELVQVRAGAGATLAPLLPPQLHP